jgi:hypothetical protein
VSPSSHLLPIPRGMHVGGTGTGFLGAREAAS